MELSQFDRDMYCLQCSGFVIINGFIDAIKLNSLCEDLKKFENEIEEYDNNISQVILRHGWPLRTTRCLYCISKEIQDLAMSEIILRFANSYLGKAVLRDCLLQTNMPDELNKQRSIDGDLSFHRDTLWKNDYIYPIYLHAFILLDDFTHQNGATFVVPGTHRQKEPGYYFKNTDPREKQDGIDYKVYEQRYFPSAVQLLAKKGALILLDPMTIHTQGINVTSTPRSLINFTFRNADIVGNPPLLNARKIAEKGTRVPVRQDLIDILESNDELPSTFGPLGIPNLR